MSGDKDPWPDPDRAFWTIILILSVIIFIGIGFAMGLIGK